MRKKNYCGVQLFFWARTPVVKFGTGVDASLNGAEPLVCS